MDEVGTALVVLGMAYLFSGLVFLLPNPKQEGHTENPPKSQVENPRFH